MTNRFNSIKKYLLSEYVTPKKIVNMINAVIQWKVFHSKKLITYPMSMTICTGNICNLRCALCPTGQRDKLRSPGFMDAVLFKKLMNECAVWLYNIDLYNWGEPFLNPQIITMLEEAKRHNIEVSISSNFMNISRDHLHGLVDIGLDTIIVSLDGASQETTSYYQVAANYNVAIENIKQLTRYKQKRKTHKPNVIWSFRVGAYNEHEIEKAKTISRELSIDQLNFTRFRCDMGKELLLSPEQQYENVERWISRDPKYAMYDPDTKLRLGRRNDCPWLYLKTAINWDGSVTPCCSVWPESLNFGSIATDSFYSVWNNDKYREARSLFHDKGTIQSNLVCSVCKKYGNMIDL